MLDFEIKFLNIIGKGNDSILKILRSIHIILIKKCKLGRFFFHNLKPIILGATKQ